MIDYHSSILVVVVVLLLFLLFIMGGLGVECCSACMYVYM